MRILSVGIVDWPGTSDHVGPVGLHRPPRPCDAQDPGGGRSEPVLRGDRRHVVTADTCLCVSNSQFSRRYAEAMQAFLWLWRRRLRPVPPGAGLSLVLDRPGRSLVGAGAWAAAVPGGRGQRGWRTRPRGGDRSGVILVHPLPVRCPPCGRRRAPRSPMSGPNPRRARPGPATGATRGGVGGFLGQVRGCGGGGGVARRGPTVGLAVRGSRPPGLRAVVCPAPSRPMSPARAYAVVRRTRRRGGAVRGAAERAGWGRLPRGVACACCAR